jgi:formate dehydrogenase major subunit
MVTFTLNGQSVTAPGDRTLLETADDHGIEIPRLCYMEGMRPDGNCRTCMVEIKGERVLAPSCCRYPTNGMEVTTNSARALTSQKVSIELLLSDVPETAYTRNSELDFWAKKLSIGKPRFRSRSQPAEDLSHPAMAVHLDACIQCKRCVRACREEQVNDVIGYAFRAGHSKIVFDFDDPMGDSTCVACGECVQACPTGALVPARDVATIVPDTTVDSVCPYCGVGCQLTYNIKDNRILYVQGKDGPANSSRLCVKGRTARLRAASPSPDEAAHSQTRHTQAQGLRRRSGAVARGVPRSDVGGGARRRRKRAARHSRHVRQTGIGWLRLGEGDQRRSVSVPETRSCRLRLE